MLILCSLTYALCSAQMLQVAGTAFTGSIDATANDHLFPDPLTGPGIVDNATATITGLTPGLHGSDFGSIALVNAQEGTPHQPPGVSALVGNRAFVHGDNTSTIEIEWKNMGRTFAVTDGHDAQIQTSMYLDIDIEVTGVPPGTPVVVYWYFDAFGGGSTSHEDIQEDSIKVVNDLSIGGVDQFPFDEFSFGQPSGNTGWRDWIGITGNIRATAGQPFSFNLSSEIELWLDDPPEPPALGFGRDKNDGIFKGKAVFSVLPLYPPQQSNIDEDVVPLFSLDIGSDTEMSEIIQGNGNEYFDPGDLYAKYNGAVMASVPPEKDDAFIFGADPDPGIVPPVNGAPLQAGMPIGGLTTNFFDLDGSDCTQLDLSSQVYGPGLPSIPWVNDSCIFESEFVFVTYDDDIAENYASPILSNPFNSSSPDAVTIYSESGTKDEVLEFWYDSYAPTFINNRDSTYDEISLHSNMDSNPIATDDNDDDVDALDFISTYNGASPCASWYFSADHEALHFDPINGVLLSPSDIYQVIPGGYLTVITSSHHGLPGGTDIDAFEFAWVWDTAETRLGLALLFSVDDDDPATADDESGGLAPNSIYYSFLDSTYHLFSPNPLADDIDGLAVWKHSLNGTLTQSSPPWGTKTWTGAVDQDWANAQNWFPQGVPFYPEDVYIPDVVNDPVVSTSGHDCGDVWIEPGATLTVLNGASLDTKN